MLKTTGNSFKKDNLSMSNSFPALNDEEDVENVYDESTNLIQNRKVGGRSSFTAAAGKKERVKSIVLKAKKESSDDETLISGSDDKECLWL
ncbi:hypothetical protein Tco_0046403 [Tanacetum coccineum]